MERNFSKHEQIIEDIQNEEVDALNNKKKNKKGLIKSLVALCLAGVTLVGSYFLIKSGKRTNTPNDKDALAIEETLEETMESTIDLDKLGKEEKDLEDNKEFSNPTNGIDPNKIVKDEDGTLWVDQDALNNKGNIGKTEIDTKGGTLKVDPSTDKVVTGDQGFEIKDPNGNTVSSGTNPTGTPDGYVQDSGTGTTVKEDDKDKFAVVDADYYEVKTGKLVYKKGEKVLKTTLEAIKNDPNLTTTKPVVAPEEKTEEKSEEKPKEEVKPQTGVVNPDGTYTIGGRTYADKATYEELMKNPDVIDDLIIKNGILYLKTNENSKTK